MKASAHGSARSARLRFTSQPAFTVLARTGMSTLAARVRPARYRLSVARLSGWVGHSSLSRPAAPFSHEVV